MKGKLLEVFDMVYKMSSLTRYSQTHLVKEESVLEHTGFVCMMSYVIAMEIAQFEKKNLDIGLLMRRAVTHDIDEIITGDIPRPTKYYSDEFREAMQEIENKNMKIVSSQVGIYMMYVDWSSAKNGNEGSIVALCDCLAVIYKTYYEVVMFGNKTIISHMKEMKKGLNRLYKRINEKENFKDGSIKYFLKIFDEAHSMCNEILKLEK